MQLELMQIILLLISGLIVGFTLGLIGGGGSILAIPLLIYFVGYDHPHLAIGTTALAVGINAYLNLIPHARKGHTNIRIGAIFSLPGIAGVLAGASVGLITPGTELLFLFAILMIVIAAVMFLRKEKKEIHPEQTEPVSLKTGSRVASAGFLAGFGSGFFGIGGGFLIVPGLMYAAGLGILEAVGTSLVSVGSFGVVTAVRYGMSGDLNPLISALFIAGGIFGGWIGTAVSGRIDRKMLTRIFAGIVVVVAVYMMYTNFP